MLSSIDISTCICYTTLCEWVSFNINLSHHAISNSLHQCHVFNFLSIPFKPKKKQHMNNISHDHTLLWRLCQGVSASSVSTRPIGWSWGSTRRNELHDDLNLLFPGLHGKRMFWCNSWLDLEKNGRKPVRQNLIRLENHNMSKQWSEIYSCKL